MNPWLAFQLADERQRRLVEEAARYRLSRTARRRRRRPRWLLPDVRVIDLTEPDHDFDSDDSNCAGQTNRR